MPISSGLDLKTPFTTSKLWILGMSGSSSTNFSNLDGLIRLSSAHIGGSTISRAKQKMLNTRILSILNSTHNGWK